MIGKEIIKVYDNDSNFYYSTAQGAFFLLSGNYSLSREGIFNCREKFADGFNGQTTRIGWFKKNLNLGLVSEFFNKIENKLKIKDKTIIYQTNHNDVIVFEISSFWRKTKTARQVFTLMLRASNKYNGSIKRAIKLYDLTRYCKEAIFHFLNGYTRPTYRNWQPEDCKNEYGYDYNGGWAEDDGDGFVYKFSDSSIEFVKSKLKKP